MKAEIDLTGLWRLALTEKSLSSLEKVIESGKYWNSIKIFFTNGKWGRAFNNGNKVEIKTVEQMASTKKTIMKKLWDKVKVVTQAHKYENVANFINWGKDILLYTCNSKSTKIPEKYIKYVGEKYWLDAKEMIIVSKEYVEKKIGKKLKPEEIKLEMEIFLKNL